MIHKKTLLQQATGKRFLRLLRLVQWGSVVVLLQIVLLLPLCVWAGPSTPTETNEVRARVLLQHGIELYQKGRYDVAIAALEEVRRLSPRSHRLRYYLARAYVQQGNQYRTQGQSRRQRHHYQQALETDPRLVEDPDFVRVYRELQTAETPSLTRLVQRPFKERHFRFGLGLTLGIEGLLGIQLGGLFFGIVNPLVTFSPVLQSLDLTLRIIPLRQFSWSPYISAGIALPLQFDRANPAPQDPGPTIHAAIGVHYIAPIGLTFTAGVSFTYNLTPNIDTPFLPMPSVQLAWYF